MKKKIVVLMMAAALAFALPACGSDTKTEEPAQENVQKEEKKEASTFDGLEGTALPEAIEKIEAEGYTATYLADGVDFTEFIADLAGDYVVDSFKADDSTKTIEVNIVTGEATANNESAEALKEKLSPEDAWTVANRYAKAEYGEEFELNFLVGKIAEEAEDENTWFLKCEGKNAGTDITCEIEVSVENGEPEVTSFDFY